MSNKGYRYLIFAYNDYYPLGGMSDCQGKTDSPEVALHMAKGLKTEGYYSYVYIYDIYTGERRIIPDIEDAD